jgi:hypothetical protein
MTNPEMERRKRQEIQPPMMTSKKPDMQQASRKRVRLKVNSKDGFNSHYIGHRTAAAIGTKTYILRSILNPGLIEYAAQSDADILEEEAVDAPSDDDDDESSSAFHHYGSIISWNTADQLGSAGVLYVILALILVSGRVMSDGAQFYSSIFNILSTLRFQWTSGQT